MKRFIYSQETKIINPNKLLAYKSKSDESVISQILIRERRRKELPTLGTSCLLKFISASYHKWKFKKFKNRSVVAKSAYEWGRNPTALLAIKLEN